MLKYRDSFQLEAMLSNGGLWWWLEAKKIVFMSCVLIAADFDPA
jgi:hypothetical protein